MRKSFVSMEWSYLSPTETNSEAYNKLSLSGEGNAQTGAKFAPIVLATRMTNG